ncbi:MAG: DinB family protein [Phycisphaerales bacterium]|nr:DinB family protein [Phycisphaerales bacterium]
MFDRIPWVERKFNFDFPVGLYHEIIERLRGTPVRIEALVQSLPKEILTKRDGKGWSIQENIGHILDTETLVTGRLDDYDRGLDTLRAADMTNRATHEANHNEKPLEDILGAFRQTRGEMVARLERLDPERFGQTALHPRLEKPMRIVDMIFFQAEHDDYHLARISALIRHHAG